MHHSPRPPDATLIRDCLLAGAIGDSLGAEIEFLGLAEIRHRFPGGLDRLPPYRGRIGAITDDTQMTLFVAEGLIEGLREGTAPDPVMHAALLRWLHCQGEHPPIAVDPGTGLAGDRRLHARRAPGNTCLTALRAARRLGAPARNHSKGCGSIMRTAPLAFAPPDMMGGLAHRTAALTHGHPTAAEAAACWTLILADLVAGFDIESAARLRLGNFGPETEAALKAALAAPRDGSPEQVERLGAGWTAEEALSITLYACLCATNLESGLRIAVTHSGDSDSTGAIAGNALGLMWRGRIADHPWAQPIECRDLIERLARDLAKALARHALTRPTIASN